MPMFFYNKTRELTTTKPDRKRPRPEEENQEMEQPGAKVTSRGVGATSLGGNLNVVVVI